MMPKVKVHILAYVVIVIYIAIQATLLLDTRRVESDGDEYLKGAYNIYHHRTFSFESSARNQPSKTDFREPGFSFYQALYMELNPWIHHKPSLSEYRRDGALIKQLKFAQVLLILGISISSLCLAREIGCGPWISCVPLLLCGSSVSLLEHVNRGCSELLGALLVLWLSYLVARVAQGGGIWFWLFGGFVLSALVLTKAAFSYYTVCLIPLVIYRFILSRDEGRKTLVLGVVSSGLVVLVMVGGWMTRNYMHSGHFELCQRGGSILGVRANLNDMAKEEYLGSFYVWARDPGIKSALSWVSGFSEQDLRGGGRLERLNKRTRGSYYQEIMRAYRKQRGDYKHSIEADKRLKDEAVEKIIQHPLKHLAVSLPLLWRGAFTEKGMYFAGIEFRSTWIRGCLNLLLYLVLHSIVLGSLLNRRWDLLALTSPALYLVYIHALGTHNIPRFNEPVLPFLYCMFALTLAFIWRRISSPTSLEDVGGTVQGQEG
jgi:hypothetical protein